MTTDAAPSQTTHRPWSNLGQIIAWVVLLFALTAFGALPLLLQGLNLTGISQSTPHGYVGDLLLSYAGRAFRCAVLSRRWRITFRFSRGTIVARGTNLVCDRTDRACASFAAGKSDQHCATRHTARFMDGCAFVFRPRWFAFRCLRFAVRRGTRLARLCATEAASALWWTGGKCFCRTSLEYLAPVVRDLTGWVVEYHWNRHAGDLHTPHFNGGNLRVDVQQHQGQSVHCDDCSPWAQSGCQFDTYACRRGRATSHRRASLLCRSVKYYLHNRHWNASPLQLRS